MKKTGQAMCMQDPFYPGGCRDCQSSGPFFICSGIKIASGSLYVMNTQCVFRKKDDRSGKNNAGKTESGSANHDIAVQVLRETWQRMTERRLIVRDDCDSLLYGRMLMKRTAWVVKRSAPACICFHCKWHHRTGRGYAGNCFRHDGGHGTGENLCVLSPFCVTICFS